MRGFKKTFIAFMLVLGMVTGLFTGVFNSNEKAYATVGFSTKLEAENAVMAGNVKPAATRAGYSGTGYATGFNQSSSNSWSMEVTLPKTHHYTFIIRSAADSYKENYLYINGAQAATIYSTGDGAWNDTVINGVP